MLIRKLLSHERPLFADHLKRLAPQDRAFRFAHPRVSDDWIDKYIAGIAADDVIMGAFMDDRLVGAVHVALAGDLAELGVSVDSDRRNHGIGAELFRRSTRWARNRRAERLYTLCQSDNRAMIVLALKLGMTIHRDCGTAEAFLPLPPPDLVSVSDELSVGFDLMFRDWADIMSTCQGIFRLP